VCGPSATDEKNIHPNMGAFLWVLVGAVVFAECVTSTSVPGVVRFAVIAPLTSSKSDETLGAILPSVDLAAQAIAQPQGSLPGWKILIEFRDGNCSSTDGPLAAFDLHTYSGECDFSQYFSVNNCQFKPTYSILSPMLVRFNHYEVFKYMFENTELRYNWIPR